MDYKTNNFFYNQISVFLINKPIILHTLLKLKLGDILNYVLKKKYLLMDFCNLYHRNLKR